MDLEDIKPNVDSEVIESEPEKSSEQLIKEQEGTQSLIEDDSDPVVARYPVYLNEKLSKYLNLFQYPMKSSEWIDQQEQQPTDARVKPIAGVVELEIPINTNHMMYSKSKGSKLAAGLRTSGDTLNVPTGKLFDVQTWSSSPVSQKAKYMIATLINGQDSVVSGGRDFKETGEFNHQDKAAGDGRAVDEAR
ncbi:DNA-directed RNA polymerase III subunit RPC5, partial [Smittium mucronatum]